MHRDQPIKVRWTNNLVDAMGEPLRHLLPNDPTRHGAGPEMAHTGHGQDVPQARVVTHLHGGVTEVLSDGYPEHWFTPDPLSAAAGMGGVGRWPAAEGLG